MPGIVDPHIVDVSTEGNYDLGLLICEFLDSKSVAKFASTTKKFRYFSDNGELWASLYRRCWHSRNPVYFQHPGLIPLHISRRMEYVERFKQQQHANLEREHVRPYLHRHPNLTLRSRANVVNWVIGIIEAEVNLQSGFKNEPDGTTGCLALWRAVQIFDAFCASNIDHDKFNIARLRNVARAAIQIAMEHHHPRGYGPCDPDKAIILRFKWTIHQCLQSKIFALPTSYDFYDYYATMCKARPFVRKYGCYLLETTLLDHDLLKYAPAKVCAACVIIALNNPKNRLVDKTYNFPGMVRSPQC